jgi:adenine nucleotide transporter 17
MAQDAHAGGRLLIEATAGGLGSLLTACLLDPVDTAKTKIQSGRASGSTLQTMREIAQDRLLDLYNGLSAKATHTVVQNFVYFYFYEWYKALYLGFGLKVSTLGNTACGVAAGVSNLTLTLPLETLSVRIQAEGRAPGGSRRSVAALARELVAEGRAGMWRGLGVSSILSLNPALTVAVFDGLKARVLSALSRGQAERVRVLSVVQSFVLGSLAKVVATLITYPLIRTKAVMQVQRGEAGRAGMALTLARLLREEGFAGLYRGCGAQIFTAVSKSGIMLTTKEQLAAFALGLVLLLRRKRVK